MKTVNKILAILLCVLWIGLPLRQPVGLAASKADVQQVIDDILTYKCRSVGAADVDALIDGDLTANAGVTADWYIFGLKQYGWRHDYTGFAESLKRFAETNEVESAVTDERVALLFAAVGAEPDYIAQVLDTAIGQLGVMSYVYGLHLLNNGCRSSVTDANAVVGELLDRQLEDGGWAVMGEAGDVDVTAMTLAALAPYYATDKTVKTAVNRALTLLSGRQTDNGGYKSFGQETPESAAQVLVALTSLGIDPLTDARFVKNGKSAFDAMLVFRLADGSFEHAKGKGGNHTATVQAFYSSVALYRFLNGQPGLYILQKESSVPVTEPPATQKPTEPSQPAATQKPTEAPKPTTTKKAETTKAPAPTTTKKAETTKAPATTKKTETTRPTTTQKTETTARQSDTTAAAPTTATTGPVTTLTAAESTTASAEAPDVAVSVIRPERSATLPDFEEPGATAAEAETEPDKQGGSPVVWYVSGGALAAAVAAVVLIKKKKKA